jgi:hypothetical protein
MNKAVTQEADAPITLLPVYTEFPKQTRGLLDLYQSALASIDFDYLIDAFLEAMTSASTADTHAKKLIEGNSDLAAAFRSMVIGQPIEKSTALRWLRGEPLSVAELRRVGIGQRISTADQVIRIFSAIIAAFTARAKSKGKEGFRLIWILDEFQRIQRCSASKKNEINAGLHSLFNASPTGLTLVLSFSGVPDSKTLPSWISPELRDRIGATKVMILPPFQPKEALDFLREVLAHFRSQAQENENPFFPFSKETCEYVIDHIVHSKCELRPRLIMQTMNAVLEGAEGSIEQGKITQIEKEFAVDVLKEVLIINNADEDDR